LIGKHVKSPQLCSKQGFVISSSAVENSSLVVVISDNVEDLVAAVADAALVVVRFGVSNLVVYSIVAGFDLRSGAVVFDGVVHVFLVEILASEVAEIEVLAFVIISVEALVIDAVDDETVATVLIELSVVALIGASVLSVVMTVFALKFAAEVVTIIDVAVPDVEKIISESGSSVVIGLASDSLKSPFF